MGKDEERLCRAVDAAVVEIVGVIRAMMRVHNRLQDALRAWLAVEGRKERRTDAKKGN